MRLLIIGASGFLGSHTLNYARSLGIYVNGTTTKKNKGLLAYDMTNDKITDIIKADEYDQAIICSAIRNIDECKKDPIGTRKINVVATKKLIDELIRLGIKPLFISTSAVFNGKRGFYTEDDNPKPVCEYGKQKLMVEEYLLTHYANKSLIIRLDKIIGDRQDEEHLLKEIDNDKTHLVLKNQVFCPTLVDDISKALIIACRYDLKGIYHFCNPITITRKELVTMFRKISKKHFKIRSVDYKELELIDERPLKTGMVISRFINDTAPFKFTSHEETIKKYVKVKRK